MGRSRGDIASGIDAFSGLFILAGILLTLTTGQWGHWLGAIPGVLIGRLAAESFRNK